MKKSTGHNRVNCPAPIRTGRSSQMFTFTKSLKKNKLNIEYTTYCLELIKFAQNINKPLDKKNVFVLCKITVYIKKRLTTVNLFVTK